MKDNRNSNNNGATPVAILISPGAVDGYPPVQHQARLLANHGFRVELITTTLSADGSSVAFNHEGVTLNVLRLRKGSGLSSIMRVLDFIIRITKIRVYHFGKPLVEIAYDPQGMFYSDKALFRPKWRIAHFHEILQLLEVHRVEKRLKSAISGFQQVVVADPDRADQLKSQLNLPNLPVSVPNYPLSTVHNNFSSKQKNNNLFEVIYCGAIGTNQKLDFIIESVQKWPKNTIFTVLGNHQTEIGERLKTLITELGLEERVKFEGWIDYKYLNARLSKADLGILLLDPSFEQFRTALGASNKRYQYMQAGLPQIGDMNPGVLELLENQNIGRCIKFFSIDELAKIVAEYVSDPTRCRSEGHQAVKLHQRIYNYEQVFTPIMDWLDYKVLKKHMVDGFQ